LAAVLLAALAGAALGALAVAVRWGLLRGGDAEVGAFVAVVVGLVVSAAVAVPSLAADGLDAGELWPFFAAGLIAPGASQVFLTLAVRYAGPSRAAIFMGTAPLMSILIALTLLDEPFQPLLVGGTVLIVLGGVALARERTRPEHFRVLGVSLALLCAALFAARDNLVRWAAREDHPPPLVAAATTLLAATAVILVYLLLTRRGGQFASSRGTLTAFVPAGLALALGYDALLAAFDRGRVSIVSPLNATGSLWAVLLAAVVIGSSEMIGRRTVLAGVLVVAGGGLIGAVR
jgi:drug/metabolite transporter (DMT)-like permease